MSTSLVSDHTPLVLDSGSAPPSRSSRFFFETSWFEVLGFVELVTHRWGEHALQLTRSRGPEDWLHDQAYALRQFLKGWGANLGKDSRVFKANLLAKIQELDRMADGPGLDEEGWALRYHLEGQMMDILCAEEEYWRQRGRQQWVLKGDANTKFFHAFANGRKRKCAIFALQSPSGLVTDKMAIQEIIYSFYHDLIGADEPKMLSAHPHLRAGQRCVSNLENEELMRSFTP
jgi:hypothetical protein